MKNNNYPDWLVSLDIAIKLKEIGFNEYCPFFVYPKNDDNEYDDEVFISGTVTVEEEWLDEDNYGEVIIDLSVTECGKFNKFNFQTIPTWEQVFAWFRERGYLYAIENEICYDFKTRTQPPKIKYTSYFETVGSGVKIHSCTSESYEEAREELVKDLIEIYREELLE